MNQQKPIETYRRIAELWADHFHVTGKKRERLIAAYVRRCQQQRFWCARISADTTAALCRLGTVMVYFDGKLLHTHRIESLKRGAEKVYGHGLLPNPPTPRYAKTLERWAQAQVKSKPQPPMATLDALTTFSKGYRDLIGDEMGLDLGGVVDLHIGIETRAARFTRPRSKFYNGTGAARFKELCSLLDADILRTIRGVQCPSMSLYNWIASGDKERRLQAVKAYPFLLPLLILYAEFFYLNGGEEPRVARSEDDWDLFGGPKITPRLTSLAAADIGQRVDAGDKLAPILAKAYDLPEPTIRQLAKHPIHHTGSALRHIARKGWALSMSTYTTAMKMGNRKPGSRAAWRNWLQLDKALCGQLRQKLDSRNDWAHLLSGMPALDDPSWDQLCARVKDIGDMGLEQAVLARIESWTLPQLLNLSERWHEERARFTREMEKEDERASNSFDPAWPSMLQEPFEAEGLRIIELNTPELLNEEALRLYHCVDGYSTYCYDGASRILSFRKGDESVATMEFRLRPFKKKPGRSHLYCAQLRGYGNKSFEESSPVTKAARKLLRHIRAGKIAIELEWPNVPYSRRPERMRSQQVRILRHMDQWLRIEVGVAAPAARHLAPAA